MSKHSNPVGTLNPQQLGKYSAKHRSDMVPVDRELHGGEDKTDPSEVRLAPNLDVSKPTPRKK